MFFYPLAESLRLRDAALAVPTDAPNQAAPKDITKALREQSLVALRLLLSALSDVDAGRTGPFVSFLGAPKEVHRALVRFLLRMVVVLFAEARGLLPAPSHESLFGIYERLAADRSQEGAAFASMRGAFVWVLRRLELLNDAALPSNDSERGGLFEAESGPIFAPGAAHLSRIGDAVVLSIFELLLFVGKERLDYASLDEDLLGSVYEGLLAFDVEVARGESFALTPNDVVVCLDDLLSRSGQQRIVYLRDIAGLEIRGEAAALVMAASSRAALSAALGRRISPRFPTQIPPGTFFLQPGEARRRLGAHYTSNVLTRIMVERTLAPLLTPEITPEALTSLRICDPAMGSGAFLLEVCRFLSRHLVEAWDRTAKPEGNHDTASLSLDAGRLIASQCVYGVDKNPLARDLARASLWLWARSPAHPSTFVADHLRSGDSLMGVSKKALKDLLGDSMSDDSIIDRAFADLVLEVRLGSKDKATETKRLAALWAKRGEGIVAEPNQPLRQRYSPFHWEIEFSNIFENGGFDGFVGNPPWVSYAGRAAQPLASEVRRYFARTSPAFAGYRNLQALFVSLAANALRPSGRLGFVLPTSMSDLGGYEPCRRAHDVLMEPDEELPDFGNAFDEVFQPSMGLLSTRRKEPVSIERAKSWPLSRDDLPASAKALLARLSLLPVFPATLFGERGFQTMGADVEKLHVAETPDSTYSVAVRVGADIDAFSRKRPRLYCDPTEFDGRFRVDAEWKAVSIYIRQTARYPMAALADGHAFRNSVLAGFSDEQWSAYFLLAWLNASPIRWLHFVRYRDARQGMPQIKITHLRSIPAPIFVENLAKMETIGREFGERNAGISRDEQERLDALVAQALGLSDDEQAMVRVWAEENVFRRMSRNVELETTVDPDADRRAEGRGIAAAGINIRVLALESVDQINHAERSADDQRARSTITRDEMPSAEIAEEP